MKESELITETAILEIHEFLKSLSAPPKDLTQSVVWEDTKRLIKNKKINKKDLK